MNLTNCVIGTAGHVDHGKTLLVEKLTGTDCDRLAEEKKRGLTIELGFAKICFDNGTAAGVVDVPGHLSFIHNMLAGACGIDIVLMVVSADDSVMPQTVEHLAILEILGVTRGVVAVTKSDIVDETRMNEAVQDIRDLLAGSTLSAMRIIPCSSLTGAGIGELKMEFERLAGLTKKKTDDRFFRLPIDRVFTIKGFGLVVTGTVEAGETEIGRQLKISPGGMKARVRKIQNHGHGAEFAKAGTRTAINIAGTFKKNQIQRSMVLCDSQICREYKSFVAQIIAHRSSSFNVCHGKLFRLNLHTFETLCRVYMANADTLKPGDSAIAEIRFNDPANLLYNDRFVLRSASSQQTLGGGVILQPTTEPMGRRRLLRQSGKFEALLKGADDGVEAIVLERPWGVSSAEIMGMFNLTADALNSILEKRKKIGRFELKGDSYFHITDEGVNILGKIERAISSFHEKNRSTTGMTESLLLADTVFHGMDDTLAVYWINRAVLSGKIEYKGAVLSIRGREAVFSGEDEKIRNDILNTYSSAGLTPPKFETMAKAISGGKNSVTKIYRALNQTGALVFVAPDFTLHHRTLSKARETLVNAIKTSGPIDTGAYRDLMGVGRKTAILLLEHFDKAGLTKRLDNKGRRELISEPDHPRT